MLDKNCVHAEVCDYAGAAFETCEKCKFRKQSTINTDKQIVDIEKFWKALEEYGADVCEHDDYYVAHGYTSSAIREVIDSCKEHADETVGVCIEHEWAEEYEGRLISNFECPYCHEWHRQEEIDAYCSHCGKPIMIVYKERKKR